MSMSLLPQPGSGPAPKSVLNTMKSNQYFITGRQEWFDSNTNKTINVLQQLDINIPAAVQTKQISYAAYAGEMGELTGYKHVHLVIYFGDQPGDRWTVRQIHKLLPELVGFNFQYRGRCSWEVSIRYFKYLDASDDVESTFWEPNPTFREFGVFPNGPELRLAGQHKGGAATKASYEAARELARQQRYNDIPAEIYLRYAPALHRIGNAAVSSSARPELLDLWIHGPSGCGKSRWVREYARRNNLPLFVKLAAVKWWDGYNGEDLVLIEDVSIQSAREQTDDYKRWTDHYAFPAEIKGGVLTAIRPKQIIFTSNVTMQAVWENEEETALAPLTRRVSQHTIGRDPFGAKCLIPPLAVRQTLTNQAQYFQEWSDQAFLPASTTTTGSSGQTSTTQPSDPQTRSAELTQETQGETSSTGSPSKLPSSSVKSTTDAQTSDSCFDSGNSPQSHHSMEVIDLVSPEATNTSARSTSRSPESPSPKNVAETIPSTQAYLPNHQVVDYDYFFHLEERRAQELLGDETQLASNSITPTAPSTLLLPQRVSRQGTIGVSPVTPDTSSILRRRMTTRAPDLSSSATRRIDFSQTTNEEFFED